MFMKQSVVPLTIINDPSQKTRTSADRVRSNISRTNTHQQRSLQWQALLRSKKGTRIKTFKFLVLKTTLERVKGLLNVHPY